jgi:arsenate reductase
MKELNLPDSVTQREIKSAPLSSEEIDHLAKKAGSYEAIFNKRARKLREKGLKASELSESEFKSLLNEDYSFLKRPVLETENEVLAGNSKSVVGDMKNQL